MNDRGDSRSRSSHRSSREELSSRSSHSHSSTHSSHFKEHGRNHKRSRSPSRESRDRGQHNKKSKVEEQLNPVELERVESLKNSQEYQKRVEEQLAQVQQPQDVDKLMEERRLKRQAILAKYQKGKQEPETVVETRFNVEDSPKSESGSEPNLTPISPSLSAFEDQPVNKQDQPTIPQDTAKPSEEPKPILSSDDSNFDMFGDSPLEGSNQGKPFNYSPSGILQNSAIETDAEGYCDLPIGTILNNQYQIGTRLGTGMFSKVFKAKDLEDDRDVAIKVIRNNEMM
jgi:hypothetical protein